MKLAQSILTNIWSEWFAWHPIKTTDGEWVWLEIVERRLFVENKLDFSFQERQYKRLKI